MISEPQGHLDVRLEHAFLRVQYDNCHEEHLVAFSSKRRGFCLPAKPKSWARRGVLSAAAMLCT
jgi:hypothetical protein